MGRFGLVLGKILGGTTLALVQGLVFVLLAPLVGLSLSVESVIWLVVVMFLLSFALTGLGFLIAWRMDSTEGFHAIMNLFLIPLWLLSGTVFPASGAPAILRWAMMCNPVSYGVMAVRQGLYWNVPSATAGLPSRETNLCVTLIFAAVMFILSLRAARRTTGGICNESKNHFEHRGGWHVCHRCRIDSPDYYTGDADTGFGDEVPVIGWVRNSR